MEPPRLEPVRGPEGEKPEDYAREVRVYQEEQAAQSITETCLAEGYQLAQEMRSRSNKAGKVAPGDSPFEEAKPNPILSGFLSATAFIGLAFYRVWMGS